MKLFNTLSRAIEPFEPIDPNNVRLYTCGPTVYATPHVGNYTSYIYWDLLIRTLEANGYHTSRILNLTDVGHLTSDADSGEDKLEKGARREGKTVWEVADFYINLFLDGYHSLNLIEPTKICRATDYISADIALIDRLTEKGFTYQISDGVYFDTSKFPTYPDFARLDLDHLRAGARVSFNNEKRNVSDFALWKFIQPGEDHAMRWDYLGRPGYPGWHIECATIIHEELGTPIDIHTGGIDHIPVHHTNEIAEAEAAYDSKLANYWLHCNFITIDGQKISKSLGNIYSLSDLEASGFTPLDFKMWVLQGHYQSERNFSFSDLDSAKTRLKNWKNRILEATQLNPAPTPDLSDQLLDTVSDNLNSASTFALVDNSTPDLDTWHFIDRLFGLDLFNLPTLTPEQQNLLEKRNLAKQSKDYATADTLRSTLLQQGITLKDTKNQTIWGIA